MDPPGFDPSFICSQILRNNYAQYNATEWKEMCSTLSRTRKGLASHYEHGREDPRIKYKKRSHYRSLSQAITMVQNLADLAKDACSERVDLEPFKGKQDLLFSLPTEVLDCISELLNPQDILNLVLTCTKAGAAFTKYGTPLVKVSCLSAPALLPSCTQLWSIKTLVLNNTWPKMQVSGQPWIDAPLVRKLTDSISDSCNIDALYELLNHYESPDDEPWKCTKRMIKNFVQQKECTLWILPMNISTYSHLCYLDFAQGRQALECAMPSFQNSRIQQLHIYGLGEEAIKKAEFPEMKYLQELSLIYFYGRGGAVDLAERAEDIFNQGIVEDILRKAENLRNIHVAAPIYLCRGPWHIGQNFTSIELKQLERLRLAGIAFHTDEDVNLFIGFLERHIETLREVSIGYLDCPHPRKLVDKLCNLKQHHKRLKIFGFYVWQASDSDELWDWEDGRSVVPGLKWMPSDEGCYKCSSEVELGCHDWVEDTPFGTYIRQIDS